MMVEQMGIYSVPYCVTCKSFNINSIPVSKYKPRVSLLWKLRRFFSTMAVVCLEYSKLVFASGLVQHCLKADFSLKV